MDKNQVCNDELEQMRHDMGELRALLSEQKIVNERLMRRAMKRELSKENRSTLQCVLLIVASVHLYVVLQPVWGLPVWFTCSTIAFMVLACLASLWSVRRLLGVDLMTGDLLEVAGRIAAYKRFGNNWLKFSIPFLILWLVGFFYYCGLGMDPDADNGMMWGGAVGAILGAVAGVACLVKSRRRLNGVLSQIEEMKEGES